MYLLSIFNHLKETIYVIYPLYKGVLTSFKSLGINTLSPPIELESLYWTLYNGQSNIALLFYQPNRSLNTACIGYIQIYSSVLLKTDRYIRHMRIIDCKPPTFLKTRLKTYHLLINRYYLKVFFFDLIGCQVLEALMRSLFIEKLNVFVN